MPVSQGTRLQDALLETLRVVTEGPKSEEKVRAYQAHLKDQVNRALALDALQVQC